jgi:hypothetical protein
MNTWNCWSGVQGHRKVPADWQQARHWAIYLFFVAGLRTHRVTMFVVARWPASGGAAMPKVSICWPSRNVFDGMNKWGKAIHYKGVGESVISAADANRSARKRSPLDGSHPVRMNWRDSFWQIKISSVTATTWDEKKEGYSRQGELEKRT